MKKEWQTPELEVLIFNIQDIITESPIDPDQGNQGTPWR